MMESLHAFALRAAAALVPFALPSVAAQEDGDAGLGEALPALMQAAGVPGLSVAVIRDGEIAWSTALGSRKAGAEQSVDQDTIFQAASLSKPVVAYTVLRLADQGVLDLDAPLSTYVTYEDIAEDERAAKITARHVLSHSTGFPNWRGSGPLATQFEPGERYQYSGEGFMYLQRAIQELTSFPLEQLIAFETFDRLGMERSSFAWTPAIEANYATGHDGEGTPRDKWKPHQGQAAGTLHTTAREYARFMIAVMNGEGLEEETHRAMLSAQVEVTGGVHWGLGVGLQQGRDGTAFWQWGDDGVFKAFMAACPDTRTGVVYFTNSETGLTMAHEIVGAVLGKQQRALDHLDYGGPHRPAVEDESSEQ